MLKDKIKEIIAIVEESNIHEVEVSAWWGRKIRITRSAPIIGFGVPQQQFAAPPAAAAPTAPDAQSDSAVPTVDTDSSRYHKTLSPIVGTYYGAPSPDADAFVKVGDKVKQGQTICIVEAMKIMNEIEADISGTVMEILVANADPVEFNQPLILVDPA